MIQKDSIFYPMSKLNHFLVLKSESQVSAVVSSVARVTISSAVTELQVTESRTKKTLFAF